MSGFRFFEEEKDLVGKKNELSPLQQNVASPGSGIPILEATNKPNGVFEPSKTYRYRSEQVFITKFDGIAISHGTTKNEFLVSKSYVNDELILSVEMTDNVIAFNPPEMEQAISLIADVDRIKCGVKVAVNKETGKIQRIVNKEEILKNWNAYKVTIRDKYGFARRVETIDDIEKFIKLAEMQITNEQILIGDLETKLFFEIFFDKYLVGKEDFKPYNRRFGSQLFEGNIMTFNFDQKIRSEAPGLVEIQRRSVMDKSKTNFPAIEKMYDERYKQIVGFKFTYFDLDFQGDVILNTDETIVEKAHYTITEEVKNNVQLVINYELKRVDL